MAETINTGSILFKDETLLPDALRFDSEPCATGWRLVKDLDGYELNRIIPRCGVEVLLYGERNQIECLRLRRTQNRSEGCQAHVDEAYAGQIQFFANHASGLEAFPGSALCACIGLLTTYPGKSVPVP